MSSSDEGSMGRGDAGLLIGVRCPGVMKVVWGGVMRDLLNRSVLSWRHKMWREADRREMSWSDEGSLGEGCDITKDMRCSHYALIQRHHCVNMLFLMVFDCLTFLLI